LGTRGLGPSQMTVLAVHGNANDLGIKRGKVIGTITEGNQFSGTDKGKVKGIEEKDLELAGVVVGANFLDFVINNGLSRPFGGFLSD